MFFTERRRASAGRSLPAQTWMIMKLTTVFLLAACLQVSANGFSQNITLTQSNVPLKKVFREIERQSGYQFFYKEKLLRQAGSVSLSVNNMPVEEVLDRCFANQPLSYSIVDKIIVIKEKKVAAQPVRLDETPIIAPVPIRGVVKDEQGSPLSGVSVVVRGTQKGTSTGSDGSFTIDANAGDVLDFSYVGYKKKSLTVSNTTSLAVQLEVEVATGSEVVVVGYGTQRKSDLTGSVASITPENFTQGPTTNALQLLNGRAAGVSISQTSSAPGAATKIQIRGAGSINSSNKALVVVDGLPGVDPSSISPDDIKSIEVLKDASSAAIYGTRAANGVVLITTKSGRKGETIVRFNTTAGWQSVARKIDVMNGRQYMETLNAIRQDAGQQPFYTQAQIDKVGTGTNWQNELFRENAPVQNYQLSISGGGDKNDYYAGLNY